MESKSYARLASVRIKRFMAMGVSLLSMAASAPLFALIVPPPPAASTTFVPSRASVPLGVVLAGASSTSANGVPSGFTGLGFPPLDNIDPGGNVTQFLYSPLTGVMPSSAFLIDRGASLAFRMTPPAPAAPLPEPTTMIAGALLLLPVGANAIRFLRKHRGVVAADVSPHTLK